MCLLINQIQNQCSDIPTKEWHLELFIICQWIKLFSAELGTFIMDTPLAVIAPDPIRTLTRNRDKIVKPLTALNLL